jgi:hypothetical protein
VSHVELGCFILITNNGQKVHREGIYQRINFASIIDGNKLETGVVVHLDKNRLMEKVQNVSLVFLDSRIGGIDLASSCCNIVLTEAILLKSFQKRFEGI